MRYDLRWKRALALGAERPRVRPQQPVRVPGAALHKLVKGHKRLVADVELALQALPAETDKPVAKIGEWWAATGSNRRPLACQASAGLEVAVVAGLNSIEAYFVG
jgi:hypothetical protein